MGSQSPISLTITAENTPGNSVDHSLTISLVNGMLDSTVAELRSGTFPALRRSKVPLLAPVPTRTQSVHSLAKMSVVQRSIKVVRRCS